MDLRPRLRAGSRPLRRSFGSLQFGVAAGRSLVLSGLSGAETRLVEALDGRHTLPELYAVAAGYGVGPDRVDTILRLLRAEGLLTTAGEQARTRRLRLGRRYVVVGGWGPAPESIAATLRAAGVGRVDTGLWAVDHAELDLRLRARPRPLPDLVVLTAREALDPTSAWPWRRHAVAVLPFVTGERWVAVGPLVTADPSAPCLHCLELHRGDRDERWPDLLAQVCAGRSAAAPVYSDVTLTAAAAGMAAMVVVGYLDSRPVPPGLTLELSLPLPRLDHRIWPRHPQCGEHPALRSAPAG
jgi:hypothetical protein